MCSIHTNEQTNDPRPATINQLMNEIHIIALDLDGTLTNENKEITPHTFAALMKAQQQGVRLCLSSGRPPYGMRPLARQLQMERYGGMLLCYNGGHIEECATGKVLVEKELSPTLLPYLHECQQRSGLTLMTYYEDLIYTEHPDDLYVHQSSRNNKMQIKAVQDFIHDTPRPLNKCLMVGSPELVPQWEAIMQKETEGQMHICRSTPYFIELLPLGIDKGSALRQMLSNLGMTTEALMAFGDSYNDISMIQSAGTGIAMGNAEEAVKSVADYVTDDNEHDGIAKALYHFNVIKE